MPINYAFIHEAPLGGSINKSADPIEPIHQIAWVTKSCALVAPPVPQK